MRDGEDFTWTMNRRALPSITCVHRLTIPQILAYRQEGSILPQDGGMYAHTHTPGDMISEGEGKEVRKSVK